MATITHINPEGMPSNPGYSQAVAVEGPAKTIYVGGQNAVTADGSIKGETLAEQTELALQNLATVLGAAGATLHDVVHVRVALLDGLDPREGFGAFQRAWGDGGAPPAVTVYLVAALGRPQFLCEIDAIAVTG